ncbi:hypothetical protein BDV36DRAFT_261594, partial [Aspergillus pseudocaelatus]
MIRRKTLNTQSKCRSLLARVLAKNSSRHRSGGPRRLEPVDPPRGWKSMGSVRAAEGEVDGKGRVMGERELWDFVHRRISIQQYLQACYDASHDRWLSFIYAFYVRCQKI